MVNKREAPLRGHIYNVNFSPTKGHEQRGIRPAVVVTPDEYNKKTGMVLACPITSKRKGYPFEVPCEIGSVSGAILVDQISVLDWHARTFEYVSPLPIHVFADVQAKLFALIR